MIFKKFSLNLLITDIGTNKSVQNRVRGYLQGIILYNSFLIS